ncbi:hypothetical protein P3S68_001295 [Capsicum galapagoense]
MKIGYYGNWEHCLQVIGDLVPDVCDIVLLTRAFVFPRCLGLFRFQVELKEIYCLAQMSD